MRQTSQTDRIHGLHRQTDGRTDGRTDRQTDRQTDTYIYIYAVELKTGPRFPFL